jgi:hypothetical protein
MSGVIDGRYAQHGDLSLQPQLRAGRSALLGSPRPKRAPSDRNRDMGAGDTT